MQVNTYRASVDDMHKVFERPSSFYIYILYAYMLPTEGLFMLQTLLVYSLLHDDSAEMRLNNLLNVSCTVHSGWYVGTYMRMSNRLG